MNKYIYIVLCLVLCLVLWLNAKLWVINAEYSQVINITWFNAEWESWMLIQSFTQKWEDLELYFVSSTWNISHYTIMDRNMWASEVHNQRIWIWNTNTWAFWYYYQWGNNYWFERCFSGDCNDYFTNNSWYITTVSKDIRNQYIPSKYARNTRSSAYNWMWWASLNDNIWWWMWDKKISNWIWTKNDRQWPCPLWYYIPSVKDLITIHSYREDSTQNHLGNLTNQRAFDLLLPYNGQVIKNRTINYLWNRWYYRTSSPHGIYAASAYSFWLGSANFIPEYNNDRNDARAIRCIKNEKNENIVFLNLNWWIKAVISIDGKKITSLDNPTKRSNDNEVEFMWRYSTENFIKWTNIKIWDTIKNWMSLYARWSGSNENVFYQYNTNGWNFSSGNTDFTNYYTLSWEVNTDNIEIPVMIWYTFSWWYDKLTGWNNIRIEIAKDNKLLYAQRVPNQYTITFDTDWWSAIEPITADYWTWITAPTNPTKNGYKFVGWDKEIPANMPAENLTIKAIWEKIWYSGWWGGRSNKTSDTQDSTTSSQNDNKSSSWTDVKDLKWDIKDSSDKSSEWQEILSPSDSSFTKEQKDAYTFAHEKWITTMPTIQNAQMDWKLTRIAMAKMLSQYAMNVLWQKPANIVTPKFNDVTDKQNSDYDDWVTLAYQLWIMWQNMPNNKFRPNDEVTRAEFATALSRMIYNTSDWEYKSTDKYYTNHMKKLVQEWIITNDDAKVKELRWYVMIMLMRSAK